METGLRVKWEVRNRTFSKYKIAPLAIVYFPPAGELGSTVGFQSTFRSEHYLASVVRKCHGLCETIHNKKAVKNKV